ncbi:MAG TPA: GAF domain-containing protein, partial [Anaerolineales bacterium]
MKKRSSSPGTKKKPSTSSRRSASQKKAPRRSLPAAVVPETDAQHLAARLAVIESIQQGLASQLDLQSIYELVGDKLRQIFDRADVALAIYDSRSDILATPYAYERGKRIQVPHHKVEGGGFTGEIFRTAQPILINENMAQRAQEVGALVLAGEMEKSAVWVPLVTLGKPSGLLWIGDMEREHAFTDGDVRLL